MLKSSNNMCKLQSAKYANFPKIDTMLKISLGLSLFAVLSFGLVYADTISVSVDNTQYVVDYTANDVIVSSIEADSEASSLFLTVDVTDSSGSLEVVLDRTFFDSKFEGIDDEFFILIDGDFADFTEIETNSETRVLNIEVPSGTEEVEIIGSSFGNSPEPPTPVEEPPTPVEEPPTPVEEPPTPVEEPPTPVEEPPTTTTPPKVDDEEPPTPTTTQCGPGTYLVDGVCVLDERCGPGTYLVDGVCVLDERCGPGTVLKYGSCVLANDGPTTQSSKTSSVKTFSVELIFGVIITFVVAGAIGLIAAIMMKASKRKN